MVPIVDTMLVTPAATVLLTVGPAILGLVIALVAGVAWMVRETGEELRRAGAGEWPRASTTPPSPSRRLAA